MDISHAPLLETLMAVQPAWRYGSSSCVPNLAVATLAIIGNAMYDEGGEAIPDMRTTGC